MPLDITDYRRDFAAYASACELAHYNNRAGIARDLELEPVDDRFSELFTLESIAGIEQASKETNADRVTERKGLQMLLGSARLGFLDRQARRLTDEVASCTSAQYVAWDDERVQVNSVPRLIANEPVPARRRDLSARWAGAHGSCNDLRAARLEDFRASARTLGFESYRALLSECTATDYEKLAEATDLVLTRTEGAYRSALARSAARHLPGVGSTELEYADFRYLQRAPELDPYFPANRLMTTYREALQKFGIRVDQQPNVRIDDEQRPSKNPRAACFRIDPPNDVRILIAPLGGCYDYTVLFHEAGHAQHFAWSSADLVRRHPEFIYPPEAGTTEAYAFLLSHLLLDPLWLTEHLSGIDLARANEITRDLAVLTCGSVRRRCALLRYELALHDSSDLNDHSVSRKFADAISEATGFRRDQALYLLEVDDEFYSASYLRAWAFEASLREHFKTRYGRRWWASRKCGDDLIDLWNTASQYSVEELASLIGIGEINFELLADNLIAAMEDSKK